MTCNCFACKMQMITILTEELIISKADVDFDTNLEKREQVDSLEREIIDLLK